MSILKLILCKLGFHKVDLKKKEKLTWTIFLIACDRCGKSGYYDDELGIAFDSYKSYRNYHNQFI